MGHGINISKKSNKKFVFIFDYFYENHMHIPEENNVNWIYAIKTDFTQLKMFNLMKIFHPIRYFEII